MKKFLSLAAGALLLCSAAFAQTGGRMVPALDTNTNAATAYLTTPALPSPLGKLALQYIGTKVSGTVAGYAILQGSLDGVNYNNLTGTNADSATLTNVATNSFTWDVFERKRVYYRIAVITSGTVSLQNKGYYITRSQ